MEALKLNSNYQVLINELNNLLKVVENTIYDENVDFNAKNSLIIKRNTIKNFIELPNDLISALWIENN